MLFVREDCESKQDPEKFPFKPANESFFDQSLARKRCICTKKVKDSGEGARSQARVSQRGSSRASSDPPTGSVTAHCASGHDGS